MRQPGCRTFVVFSLSLLSFIAPSRAAAERTKYLAIIRGLEEPKGTKSGILIEAREALLSEVDKHPELSLSLPSDLPMEREALAAELRKRHLRAVEVSLNVLHVDRQLSPPAPGKRFSTLSRKIHLTITGTQLPDWMVALTGDGEAEVASEVGPRDDLDKEARSLLVDAARAAVAQAMDELVIKLRKGPPTPQVTKKHHR